MTPLHILFFFFLLVSLTLFSFSFSFSFSSATGDSKPTVYEALQDYNFPVGILPVGITKYELDRSTGKFKVYLEKTCEFYVQDYKLKYKSTISGTVSKNELKNLSGISVKILLFWLNIGEVSRDGDDLDFIVGILSAGFEIDNFDESPQCGCGFDCNNHSSSSSISSVVKKDGDWYLNRFVYSSS